MATPLPPLNSTYSPLSATRRWEREHASFAIDTDLISSAAQLLNQLGQPAAAFAGPTAGAPSLALQPLHALLPAISPGAAAVAEFIRLSTAALDDQHNRVGALEAYGQAASETLSALVGSAVAADTSLAGRYSALNPDQ